MSIDQILPSQWPGPNAMVVDNAAGKAVADADEPLPAAGAASREPVGAP